MIQTIVGPLSLASCWPHSTVINRSVLVCFACSSENKMSSLHFSSKFSVVEFLGEKSFAAVPSTWLSEEEDKQMSCWPKGHCYIVTLREKTFHLILFIEDYKIANLNVDEARVLSSGQTQSSSCDSENVNSRRNKIHSKNPAETTELPFKAPISAFNFLSPEPTPCSSSSSAVPTDFIPITNSTREEVVSAPDSDINISEVTPFVIHTVPSESDNNVEQFEQGLGDPKSKQILLVELVKFGGVDLTDTTDRILSEVFGHSIALKTSKTGKGDGNQFSFMKWKCFSIIIDAILKNPKCNGKTKLDVEVLGNQLFLKLKIFYRSVT
ncbi:hypothetical protein Fcan01_11572 [Folsomia candida]|uniref:DUF4806 domain-containing protein n=1 Tax=Folsomia candida TaxID=158441 RepID=A0A226EDH9_FOLCA|nr:hypothetical protein Fcan01_11572 [Folsomia candida]